MFYVALPFVLVVSFGVGWWLTKMSFRPIETIIYKVNEINSFDMKRRLPVSGSGDEIDRLSQTLNNVLNRLEKSFHQVKRFTSDASHELRTPLTIMRGELELALQKRKSAEEYEYIIASSLEEVDRMTNVVETLLELSKADTGQAKLDSRETNISNIISDIAEDAEILAHEKNISVDTDIDKNIIIKVDPLKLYQAVLNIVDNAIKYTPHNGSIGISLKTGNQVVAVSVKDTGIGISREKLPNIFDRFYRIDESRSAEVKGVGLGLSISQWIVAAHKGEIEVASSPGKGSEFTIRIPHGSKSFDGKHSV
jgi:heavy metal sensor kinase